MLLTEDKLHTVALDARSGLRECLYMLDLHARQKSRSYLNGPIVLTAVATWERFVMDLIEAAELPEWDPTNPRKDRDKLAAATPWPGGNADSEAPVRKSGRHVIDHRLIEAAVLADPLTPMWRLWLATRWTGSDAKMWTELPESSNLTEIDPLTKRYMLGAKSARDAIAHRLYYKKARDADRRDEEDSEIIDEQKWHYVWMSDNTTKASSGRPTIQNGYARGVVAMFIQLIDGTTASICSSNDWHASGSRLPRQWFEPRITRDKLRGAEFWNGQHLLRRLY